MTQLAMTGDDWTSERDRKAQAKAEAARKKAAQKCAEKLFAATDAIHAYSMACFEVGDASVARRSDDSRVLLAERMREYAAWLDSKYGEKP